MHLVELTLASDNATYHEGAEDGFWRGFEVGASFNLNYIMGFGNNPRNPYDVIPREFGPRGPRWYPINYAENSK